MNSKDFPAFPTGIGLNKDKTWIGPGSDGMTLRDYFAAKAMQGLIHHFDFCTFSDDPMRLALWAYAAADAMLKAREQ